MTESANTKRSNTTITRPRSVTFIGCLFIGAGVVGLAYHANEFNRESPFQDNLVWVSLVRLLAIVGGLFVLRGANWARWLLLLWIAYHVILSAWHSLPELVMHGLLLLLVAYVLLRARASAYFRAASVW